MSHVAVRTATLITVAATAFVTSRGPQVNAARTPLAQQPLKPMIFKSPGLVETLYPRVPLRGSPLITGEALQRVNALRKVLTSGFASVMTLLQEKPRRSVTLAVVHLAASNYLLAAADGRHRARLFSDAPADYNLWVGKDPDVKSYIAIVSLPGPGTRVLQISVNAGGQSIITYATDKHASSRSDLTRILAGRDRLILSQPHGHSPATAPSGAPSTSEVMQTLGFTSEDPTDYSIQNVTFAGSHCLGLVYTDPQSGARRLDGEYVRVGSQSEWVRGVYYPPDKTDLAALPDLGGIVFDAPFPKGEILGRTGFLDSSAGPEAVYEGLFRAIANQVGISLADVPNLVKAHDYSLDLYFPRAHTSGLFMGAPAPLEADLEHLDLRQPLDIFMRPKSNSEGLDINALPTGTLFTDSIASNYLVGVYTAPDGSLHYAVPGTVSSWPSGSQYAADDIWNLDELVAHMSATFTDTTTAATDFQSQLDAKIGRNYKPGNTVIPADLFFRTDPTWTAVTYSITGPTFFW